MNTQQEIQPGKSRFPSLVVIDDEEHILSSLQRLFRKDSYKTYFFASSYKALEFMSQNNVDVIISDMRMPEMNGAELLERSLEICPNAIRIIISGYEEKSVILNAIAKGLARHYVMKPWDDEQLRSIVHESMELQNKLRHKQIREVLLSFKNLPSAPRLHNHLKEILQKDMLSQKEISAEIEKSPALVAKLLRMSNSIFYGVRKPISSIFDALTFIGVEAVLNLVLGLESFDHLCSTADDDILQKAEEIRIKSVMRAQIAREISLKWTERVDPQEAYVASLMLDIGLVLRFCSTPEKFNDYMISYNNGNSAFGVDKEIFKITHDEVGEALLTYWNFSPAVISAVANHHCYVSNDALTTIVQIADLLVQGNDSYPHDPKIDEYAEEWKIKLKYILDAFKYPELFPANPLSLSNSNGTSIWGMS